MKNLQDLLQAKLQETFGLKEFRKGQREAITTLLTEGRALCILPTGYGKSLLYQLPAAILDGITLVISPLLALMRDQIDHLNRRFNIPAMAINSDQSEEENAHARLQALKGSIKILFIAPEQLDHVDRFEFLLNLNVKLVVVDEAHCISTWGHDFRPSYRQIMQFLHACESKHKEVKILGLTATANKRVEEDIHRQLFFNGRKGIVLRQSMDRPNIQLEVIPVKGVEAKLAACDKLLKNLEGCGLIYCATRENTEMVAEYLIEKGWNVAAYHAGFETEQKRKLQQEFVQDHYKALSATNALGMGIDKGNLRFIIHFDFPGSITAYYQEVGRCGRDGQPARGIMLYDPKDCTIHNYFIHSALPSPNDFQLMLDAITNAQAPPGLITLKTISGLHPTRVTIVIAELLEQKFIEKYSLSGKQVYRTLHKQSKPDLSRYENQLAIKMHELEQIKQYGEQLDQCKMSTLRRALGDVHAEQCGSCLGCLKTPPNTFFLDNAFPEITTWLEKRPVIIAPIAKEKVSQGFSLFDSKIRSPLFVHFMRERTSIPSVASDHDIKLLEILKARLKNLAMKEKISGIIVVPSRTWAMREQIANTLSEFLQVPCFTNTLTWVDIPLKRQGELLNNDQRRDNVKGKMHANPSGLKGVGTYLLFDDYIGSGSTIQEAARALRASGVGNPLIPITIAALKWHLGKPGFV